MKKLKEIIKYVILVSIVLAVIIGGKFLLFGNRDVLDNISPRSNIWTYAIVEIGGKTYEGEIKSWADYENGDALKIVFKDGTEVITSYNRAILSKEKIDWR